MLMRKISSMAVSSSSRSNTNPSSQFPNSRLLFGLSAKPTSDAQPSASPTSILETKFFSTTVNHRKPRPPLHGAELRAVGLGIINDLHNEKPEIHRKFDNPDSRMVLFGSQIKIQIPSMDPASVSTAGWAESPGSPIEFGVKNKSSQLALLSPAPRSPMACSGDMWPPSTDMELSEDYTCVIAHGPNPRTTHIFDNCIVESSSTNHGYVPSPREKRSFAGDSVSFLAFCHACMKSLGTGNDIFMYRGEKAFCSNECQHREMMFNEGIEKSSSRTSTVL